MRCPCGVWVRVPLPRPKFSLLIFIYFYCIIYIESEGKIMNEDFEDTWAEETWEIGELESLDILSN